MSRFEGNRNPSLISGAPTSEGWKADSPSSPQVKKEKVAGDPDPAPVYSGHFRITRELVFGAEPQLKPSASPNADIIVKGFFRYQACTVETCFPPRNVPLERSLSLFSSLA